MDSGETEVWLYKPGDSCLNSYSYPTYKEVGGRVILTRPGKLLLSYQMTQAVSDSVSVISKIAPDVQVAFCKALSYVGGSDETFGGMMIYGTAQMLPTILLATDEMKPSHVLELAFHEAFHHIESQLGFDEMAALERWRDRLDYLPAPPFVEQQGLSDWWAKPQERRVWSFEHYIHLTAWPRSVEYARYKGFHLELDDFPEEVKAVYDDILSGEIGLRAIEGMGRKMSA